MESQINLQDHSCCHEGCPDYGKRGLGNIVIKERYGKNDRALLKCRTCGHCFSETRGTIFFGLNTPEKEVLDVLALPMLSSKYMASWRHRHTKELAENRILCLYHILI